MNNLGLHTLRSKAEDAVSTLTSSIDPVDEELRQQLAQLNLPSTPLKENGSVNGMSPTPSKQKSNLHSPSPANMPLALLRLMEAYIIGLAEVEPDRGGWPDAKRERALAIVKELSASLGDAERLASSGYQWRISRR